MEFPANSCHSRIPIADLYGLKASSMTYLDTNTELLSNVIRLAKEYGANVQSTGLLNIDTEVTLLSLFAEARETMEAVDHIRAVA